MLRIGYVRRYDADRAPESSAETKALTAFGCDVVHLEQPSGKAFVVLQSILDFIGDGDQLVVGRLEHLGANGRSMLAAYQRLECRGASLRIIDPDITSDGPGGPALRAALEAVAAVEAVDLGRPRREEIGLLIVVLKLTLL